MTLSKKSLALLVCLISAPTISFAEEPGQDAAQDTSQQAVPDEQPNIDKADVNNTLTGDWGGVRKQLIDRGISISIPYKVDLLSNVHGGIKTGTNIEDNLDVITSLDGEKLFGSKGTSALIDILNNDGRAFDAHRVGSAQVVDNIEVPAPTAKVFQAWVQQNFYDDKLSILAGIYALDSEFDITDSSTLFLHSAYGFGSEIALTGKFGPAIFPFSALGTRIKIKPTEDSYVQLAISDGVPGDPPDHLHGTHLDLRHDDGAFIIGEAGTHIGGEKDGGKVAFGGWTYTEKYPDFVDKNAAGTPIDRRSYGFYTLAEHALYREPGSKGEQGLDGFVRFGIGDGDVNRFDYAYAAGLTYTGLIPGRDEGKLGLAIAPAHNSGNFKRSMALAGTPVNSTETTFELTYNDPVTPWLSVQPDMQYVVHPNTDPARNDAVVLGTRVAISF